MTLWHLHKRSQKTCEDRFGLHQSSESDLAVKHFILKIIQMSFAPVLISAQPGFSPVYAECTVSNLNISAPPPRQNETGVAFRGLRVLIPPVSVI